MKLGEDAAAVRSYTESVTDELKEKGAGKVFRLGDLRLYECPLSFITEDTAELIRIVFLIDASGSLLFTGGWGDQPCWLIEAYEIYKNECVRYRVKETAGGDEKRESFE